MRTVRFLGQGQVAVETVPDPQPDEQSVIIRVRASALCGSELHCLRAGAESLDGRFNSGHEVAGEIVSAPRGSSFRVGQRVGACVVQGCGHCRWCDAGDETACENKRYDSGNGHSELYKLGLRGVRVLPDDVDWPRAAVLSGDGLGVPVRCARRLGDTRGKKILVIGLGPVGLSCVLVQSWRGATVAGIDLEPYRLELAKKIGAQHTHNVASEPIRDRVMAWTNGLGADVVILAVARQQSLELAFEVVRRHGIVFQVAELEQATLNFSKSFLRREATMQGSWYYTTADWKTMLQWHADGLPYEQLITHVLPIERAQEAFDTFSQGQSGKVVLTYE